jgi:hypothetical protein
MEESDWEDWNRNDISGKSRAIIAIQTQWRGCVVRPLQEFWTILDVVICRSVVRLCKSLPEIGSVVLKQPSINARRMASAKSMANALFWSNSASILGGAVDVTLVIQTSYRGYDARGSWYPEKLELCEMPATPGSASLPAIHNHLVEANQPCKRGNMLLAWLLQRGSFAYE